MSETSKQAAHERAPQADPGADAAPGSPPAPSPSEAAAHDRSDSLDGRDSGAAAGDSGVAAGDSGGASEIEGDLDELVRVSDQRDEYLALAQRTQADFENYRRRVARESALAQERGMAKLARELLPALDNLDRALEEAASTAGDDDPLLQGVRLVRCELSDALARMGIESFAPAGEPFDPALHEAMASAPQPPEGPASGTVVEVYQPGYRLGEHVIRPARVLVAA
jgi:molecular chaperone GrpE